MSDVKFITIWSKIDRWQQIIDFCEEFAYLDIPDELLLSPAIAKIFRVEIDYCHKEIEALQKTYFSKL